ncbi:MAG: hypothetical protein QXD70_02385 [Candidatus Bathyarchaeia archaeon]
MANSKFFLVAVFLLATLTFTYFVDAYNPPAGDNPIRADPTQPSKGHERITRQAIAILWNDGYREIALAANRSIQAIIDGLKAADDELGRIHLYIGLSEFDWNTAGNTHYYNPNEPHQAVRGLKIGVLHVPDTVLYGFFGFMYGANTAFALRGPQPSAARLADWYYALAVKAMREGRNYDAYFNLGKAIHIVQDLTVPQHATDSFGLPHHRHQDFENYAEDYLLRPDYLATTANAWISYSATSGYESAYISYLMASGFAEIAARNSAEKISRVSWWHDNDFDGVEREMLILAQRLTAGLLHKFHQNWQTEPYSALKLTVHRAKALDVDRQNGENDAAELFTTLNVLEPGDTTRTTNSFINEDFLTGYFGDENVVRPGAYLPHEVTTFPYTSDAVRSSEEVRMILGLYDDDDIDAWTTSVSGWPEELYQPHWLDINPDVGPYRLELKINFRTGEVSRWTGRMWLVIGRLGERIVSAGTETRIDYSNGGRGEVEFSIQGIYIPAQEPVPHSPQKPVNMFPTASQRGMTLTPTLVASSYFDLDGDRQRESEWIVSEIGGDFVYQVLGGASNRHTLTTPLVWGKTYGWMVRYQDSTGRWSDWSTPTFFFTNTPPVKPINELPANGAVGVSFTPCLMASTYFDFENQTHVASEWKIYYFEDRMSDGLGIRVPVTVYTCVSVGVTSHVVPRDSGLRGNTTYWWVVRYQDALGVWSEWSTPTSFTTMAVMGVNLASPKAGETLYVGKTIDIAWQTTSLGIVSVDIAYSVDAGKTWVTIAQGEPNDGVYSWTIPNTPSKICYVRITARDSKGQVVEEGYSAGYFTILRGQ